jgi:5-methyltetrahydropteroyltriglutamate--homocysteine methyltransferase
MAAILRTTIAGSLPKPAWLAETQKLWPAWRLSGDTLDEGKRDAVLAALKLQERAGIDIVTDGEQTRQHFVHGFLEKIAGINFAKRQTIGIRGDRYKASCPTVTAPVERTVSVHGAEARFARANTTKSLKFTLPGPMTIVDTLADEQYRDRGRMAMAFAEALNEEALDLEAAGVDVIQFDEPAFNVYADEVRDWGIATLERAAKGLKCKTAVHICYGYGIQANIDWKNTLGTQWRQYESVFPLLAKSKIDQVSLECIHSKVPMALIGLLAGKDVMVGVIDVASDTVETPEEVAQTIRAAMEFVRPDKFYPCTNCGMAPMSREVAAGKLKALADGAALVRRELA